MADPNDSTADSTDSTDSSAADSSAFTLTDEHFSSLNASAPPAICSFTALAGDGSTQATGSLQILKGVPVTLAWQIDGQVDELSIDGASSSLAADATSLTDTPQGDVTYTLHAKNPNGESEASVAVAVHAPAEVVSAHALVVAPALPAATGPIALVSGNDVLIDPPVRVWPQWPGKGDKKSKLQGERQLAGADGMAIPWWGSGCGPSSAASILRWFAEDCKAGRIPFPSKDGSQIDKNLYGPRMAQAFWPDGFKYYKNDQPGNPLGKVELDNSGVDNMQLENRAAKLLGSAKAHRETQAPAGGWLGQIAKMLQVGPVFLGIGAPSPHGHFIVGHGVRNGALLVVDPGLVLYSAWNQKPGFATGAYMPPDSQWPSGLPAGGYENDKRAYNEVSGALLDTLLGGLQHVTSLTYPAAPVLQSAGGQAATPAATTTAAAGAGPNPNCADCKTLQALIDDGTIASKVFERSSSGRGDKTAITALQKHLIQFGYDLGASGADGDFGGGTMQVLSFFFIELGLGYLRHKILTADDAKIVLQQCQAGFKSKNARATPPAAQPASADQVYSSQIQVGGTPFVDWFNGTFQPANTAAAQGEFDNKIYCPGNFGLIFDRIAEMSGSTPTPLNQFIALFCIFYNEEGGTFLPLPEEPEIIGSSKAGGLAYCFYGSSSKESYNTGGDGTVKAGTGLAAAGAISAQADIDQWNGPTTLGVDSFPYTAPAAVLEAAKNCDFFKYRGHGLSQITYRAFHKKYVDPVLPGAGYQKTVLQMTTRELDQAFTDPAVYLAAVNNEWHDKSYTGPAFAAVATDTSKFFDVGHHIGGSKSYGTKFALRCNTLRDAMLAAGVSCT